MSSPTFLVLALGAIGVASPGPSLATALVAGAFGLNPNFVAQLPIKSGREQVIHPIAAVTPGSSAERVVRSESDPQAGEGPPILCFVYDEFWMLLPMWTANGQYAVAREFRLPAKPRFIRFFSDQSTRAVAAATGVSEERLGPPWTYYVPYGWVAMAVIAVVLGLLCGSPPSRRYHRLWGDQRYRAAIAGLIGKPGTTLPDEPTHGAFVVPASWEISDEWLKPTVASLSETGIGPGTAESDLKFLLEYLATTGVLVSATADNVRMSFDPGLDAP
jgi:hypothetical protein